MSSLGSEVYCGKLTVRDSLQVAGVVNSSHKVIGQALNQGELHHLGSIFYIKWSAVHQAGELETTSGSTTVTWTTTGKHGLAMGNTVHISALPNNPGVITEVNGVLASELVGTHQVTATPSLYEFSIAVTTQATATGSTTDAVPLVRIDRYRYTDMSNSDPTWTNATTLPSPGHTNTESFYL